MSNDLTSASDARPDKDTMRGVIPYLNLKGQAGEAADFYGRAFGATEQGRMPNPDKPGQFLHIQVAINGGALMMTDHVPDGETPVPGLKDLHMQLVVEDGQLWWQRAVKAGCRELAPYEPQFWGDTWGLLEDPFGIQWAVLEPGPEPQS